jgi:hypothetical protein
MRVQRVCKEMKADMSRCNEFVMICKEGGENGMFDGCISSNHYRIISFTERSYSDSEDYSMYYLLSISLIEYCTHKRMCTSLHLLSGSSALLMALRRLPSDSPTGKVQEDDCCTHMRSVQSVQAEMHAGTRMMSFFLFRLVEGILAETVRCWHPPPGG